MNTLIKLLVVCSIICSCTEVRYAESVERNERENITSNTVVVNMKSNEYEDVVLLSDIIKDVKYLDLEDTEESSLYPTKNIKVIDSLIYIQDIEDQLKCFDIQGRFQRNTYRRGNGPDEVVKFYDYDVDDTYVKKLTSLKKRILKLSEGKVKSYSVIWQENQEYDLESFINNVRDDIINYYPSRRFFLAHRRIKGDFKMAHSFFAFVSRLKNITRWSLMRNALHENVQEHSHMVAAVAHALAVIRRDVFDGKVDPNAVAAAALYHDAPEILTGDLPTPVKYYSP